jgi:hypothetical protein
MCEMVWQVWNMSDDCLGWHTDSRRTADRVADADGVAVCQAPWSHARSLGRPMCEMVSPGKRKCVVGEEGELVECAGDLGNDAEEAAITHQLVERAAAWAWA